MKAKKKKPTAAAKPASRIPKGEIDLGSTIASKRKLTLGEAQELNRRTEAAYGSDPMDIRSGNPGLDARNDRYESEKRQARARAGSKFYDGDGGGAARRKKDYADELENRIDAKMMMEKIKSKQYKFGGKIYKDGGLALFKALKKKFGEG